MAGSATIAGSMQTYPQTLQGWLEHCERLHAKNIDMGLARVGEVAQLQRRQHAMYKAGRSY